MSRIVIVGAGAGGLAAAARLARLRHDVVVVEQAPTVGGRWRRREHDGFRFDPPDAVVRLPAVLRDLFLKTGKALEAVTALDAGTLIATHRFPDGSAVQLPNAGPRETSGAVGSALGTAAAAEWDRLLDVGRQVWDAGRGSLLETPAPTSELRSWALRHPRRAGLLSPRRDLRRLTGQLRDERVRALAGHYAAMAGWPIGPVPTTVAALPYVEQAFRVWHPAGGIGAIVDAVHERALERGVVVITGVRATAIAVDAGTVGGVRLEDGRTLPADVVVSDVGSRTLYGELLPDPARLARLRRASSVHVELRLHDRSTDEPTRTVWHGSPTLDVRVEPNVAVVSLPPGVTVESAPAVVELLTDRGLDLRDRVVGAELRSTPADVEHPGWLPDTGPGTAVRGLFTVGRSPAFGRDLSFVVASAAAVAERVGRA